jgi:LuxR family transcriptional regulator
LIVQFLVLAGEARDAGELTGQLEGLLAAYEFDFYVLSLHPTSRGEAGSPILAARWPRGWQNLYAAKRYALVDPTRRMLALAHRPFRLRDAVSRIRSAPNRTRMNRMMQDAARHGIADGYVFPIHGRTGLLGSLRVSGRPVDLSPVELALFDMAAKKVLWRFLEVRGSVLELEKGDPVEITLTRRELEVVSHLAEGLTSPEIANILQISSHTVDWYIHGMQDKMKAKNRQHVVALALRKGFIA